MSKEAITVEYNGKILGYFYPINDLAEVNRAKDELVQTIEKVMQETGWNEEQLVNAFTESTD